MRVSLQVWVVNRLLVLELNLFGGELSSLTVDGLGVNLSCYFRSKVCADVHGTTFFSIFVLNFVTETRFKVDFQFFLTGNFVGIKSARKALNHKLFGQFKFFVN